MHPSPLRFLAPAVAGLAFIQASLAGPTETASSVPIPAKEPSPWVFSSEVNSSYSFVAPTEIDSRLVSEQAAETEIVVTSQYKEGPPLRLGVDWERFSFSNNAGSRVPNTLQSESMVAGLDFQVGSSIFGRLEAQPGLYSGSSRVTPGCFDVPVIFGASYLYSKDLQLILGFLVDAKRNWPLFPGGGIRWQINDQWLLNGVMPRPRLEYKLTSEISLFSGASVFDNTFRVDGDFGDRVGNPKLNSAWVDYTELRVGAGATVKVNKVNLDMGIGYMAFRDFNFHRADIRVDSGEGGFYAELSLQAKF